jgi:hypothetical protein
VVGASKHTADHLWGETGSAHTEEHDVAKSTGANAVVERFESGHLRRDDVERVQPSEAVGDRLPHGGTVAPHIEATPPERGDKLPLFEPRDDDVERGRGAARLNGEGRLRRHGS